MVKARRRLVKAGTLGTGSPGPQSAGHYYWGVNIDKDDNEMVVFLPWYCEL